ncbi:MAG: hypothetical protein J2P47_16580 [Acetobacteraceae bacterium]|nr:hypothetical protein [Acetobacteraceae bacterium]
MTNVATKADLRELQEQLEHQITRMTIRLGSLAVVLTGLMFAALEIWPPH